MTDDLVKIEVDGRELEARKGAMLIEVTDAAGIAVPRFCYHRKLSVAANCRMCLVEVEKAPKPLPACATPVTPGMKVYTASPKAIAAQKGTMEFLLINHPLDCPICDQGGECELQDLSMGYGAGVSQFVERKRVVRDKNIGPLIATEMTRCIHCTRCVRFGEEIANLRELGATGRGEHMEIGTYIEKSLVSELSGNVIDLCPVGALTDKPARNTGRSWEYVQHAAVSPHDCVGSNLYVHNLRGRIMRIVPRENEAVNEVWIADRDRYSYQGVYAADRVLRPLVRGEQGLVPTGWAEALEEVRARLQAVLQQHGPGEVGVLASPGATLEELYLLSRLARGLGISSIDHRLRQGDFRTPAEDPVYPSAGLALADLERVDVALLVGSDTRMEQPLVAHRLRKAVRSGARITALNPRDFDFRFDLAGKLIGDPARMLTDLALITRALASQKKVAAPKGLEALLEGHKPDDAHRAVAEQLAAAGNGVVLLGALAIAHPAFVELRSLAVWLARTARVALGYLPPGANACGAWLAGVVPHRLAGGRQVQDGGLDAHAMFARPRKAYVLFGAVEPELDCWDGAAALSALGGAELVVCATPFLGRAGEYAHVVLPIAAFAETSGSLVNAEGRCQSFEGAVKPPGDARPGWKVLRVLANGFQLAGFEQMDSREVLEALLAECADVEADNLVESDRESEPWRPDGVLRVGEVPIYSVDPLVRRGTALQESPLRATPQLLVNGEMAAELRLEDGSRARVQGTGAVELVVRIDESVPNGCVMVPAAVPETAALGPQVGPVTVSPA